MKACAVFPLLLVGLVSVISLSCGGSNSDPSSPANSRGGSSGSDQFEVVLVRITNLEATGRAAFSNIGMDILRRGKVEVEERNEVEVKVRGAIPGMTYNVTFCPFATGTANCLVIGSLTTNANGDAEAEFNFPQTGTFAGVFVLTRSERNQFVTGLTVPSRGEEREKEELFEVALQQAAAISGGLGPGFNQVGSDPLAQGKVELERESASGKWKSR